MAEILYPLTTLSFAYPAFLFAPVVILFFAAIQRDVRSCIPHGGTALLAGVAPSLRQRLWILSRWLFGALSVVCVSVVAARPQKLTAARAPAEARNIFFVIDVSPSMGFRDFRAGFSNLTRLDALQQVLRIFIEARGDDRLGVVAFGGETMLLSPLTFDHALIQETVRSLEVGMAGQGTAIGDGLGTALKRIRTAEAGTRAIVLVTDGVSNAGQVNPIKAAKVAAELAVKVHTVGIGSGDLIEPPPRLLSNPAPPRVEYDEDTLSQIAALTGGIYFKAEDLAGLERVYQELNALEQARVQATPRIIAQELFVPYAVFGAAFYGLYLLVSLALIRRIP